MDDPISNCSAVAHQASLGCSLGKYLSTLAYDIIGNETI